MVPKLRFKEFCGEWEEKRLGDVIQYFYNGQTPSRNNLSFWNGNIPWVSSGELNYNTIKYTNEYITEDGKRNAHLKLLPKGTFLIAITGLEAPGTRGSCAFLGIDATTNQSCMALVPYENKLNSKFLFQWYMKIGEHYGIKYTQGTKQQSYNMDLLKRLPIILPDSLYEQTKIADFLSTVDDKIQNQQDKITHLENIKKGFMQKIFSRKIRFKDDSGEDFPEWEEKKLGDIVEVKSGKSPNGLLDSKGEIPFFKVEQLNNSIKYQEKTPYYIKKQDENIIKLGSIIFPKRGAAILLNKIRILKQDSFMDTNLMTLTIKNNNYYNEFIYYKILVDDLSKIADTTSIPQINNKHIEPYKIKVPSLPEQTKIADFLSLFDEKIYIEKQTLEHLKELKKGLLQQMFV